jgi:hypothetical protein
MTTTRLTLLIGLALVVAAFLTPATSARTADGAFIAPFNTVSTIASTVPRNGDVNPYGVAVVPVTMGNLVAGDVLVSNFNNRQNLQGTGKTIVEISPSGQQRVFASIHAGALPGRCPGGVGLTTALVALTSGWVIVGSLPTRDGTSQTARAGCLLILNPMGDVVSTIFGAPINGPWDMTAADNGDTATLFVTNVLNGTVAASPNTVNQGTVVRIVLGTSGATPQVNSITVIGQGFSERTDPAALVVGPTGLGLASDGTLYVADSVNNRIASISNATTRMTAGRGFTVSKGGSLNDPLGLAMAPNGDILTTNGGDGNLVETTPAGAQVAVKTLDSTPAPPGLPGNGTLFGLAVTPSADGVYFVDDGSNTLNLLH